MLGRKMLIGEPYEKRRELLQALHPLEDAHAVITPAYRDVDPQQLLTIAREHQLEGLVAKKIGSHDLPGRRSHSWIKHPLIRTQDLLVCGWRPGHGSRADTVGSLVLGAHDQHGQLRLVGDVGSGFTRQALVELDRLLAQIPRETSPFAHPVPPEYAHGTQWVEPVLVGQVAYRSWTREGRLRRVAWRGFRPADLTPQQVVMPPAG